MGAPTIAFVPADKRHLLLLEALMAAESSFSWTIGDPAHWRAAIQGAGDGGTWMSDLVRSSDMVMFAISEQVTWPITFERAWRDALASSKPVALLLCQDTPIPEPLLGCPQGDLREFLKLQESSSGATANVGPLQRGMESIAAAVRAAWDQALATPALRSLEAEIVTASGSVTGETRDGALQRLQRLSQLATNARELQCYRLSSAAEEALRNCHNSIVTAEGASAPRAFLDEWARWLDESQMPNESSRVRLAALPRVIEAEGAAAAPEYLRGVWVQASKRKGTEFSGHMLQLRPAFLHALKVIFQQLLAELDRVDVNVLAEGFECLADLANSMNASDDRTAVLMVVAQVRATRPEGSLRAVRAIEALLELNDHEYPAATRETTFQAAEAVAASLEQQVENLATTGRISAACEALQLLARIRRALPDQQKLAEVLAYLTNLGSALRPKPGWVEAARQEAGELADVYGLRELDSLLAPLEEPA